MGEHLITLNMEMTSYSFIFQHFHRPEVLYNYYCYYYFTLTVSSISKKWVPAVQVQALFCEFRQDGREQANTSSAPRYLSLWSPAFLTLFLPTIQEAIRAPRVC